VITGPGLWGQAVRWFGGGRPGTPKHVSRKIAPFREYFSLKNVNSQVGPAKELKGTSISGEKAFEGKKSEGMNRKLTGKGLVD